jgi:hypothetical protein
MNRFSEAVQDRVVKQHFALAGDPAPASALGATICAATPARAQDIAEPD